MARKSLREIAKLAGLSIFAVSLALRNNPKISPATRERVQKIAREIGYVPNAGLAEVMARTRATALPGYQSTLAYLDATLVKGPHYTFDSYKAGVIARAGELGYKVDVLTVDDLVKPPAAVARILRSRGIKGMVIMWPHRQGIPDSWQKLWKDRKCVFLAARPEFPLFALAMTDHFQVGAMAYQKAVEAGHKKIGIVQHAWLDSVSEGRFMGGIYAQQQLAPETRFTVLKTAEGASLLDWYRRHRHDCLITMEEWTRLQLGEAGVGVPDEVSLIYWDVHPRLHGIYAGPEQPPLLIAEAAVDLLVQKVRDNQMDEGKPQRCVLVEPVWRDGPSLRKR